jgi:hypothetical protein
MDLREFNAESVLDYLIQENFAPDLNGARAIYESMSEDWLNYILEVTTVRRLSPKGSEELSKSAAEGRSTTKDNHRYMKNPKKMAALRAAISGMAPSGASSRTVTQSEPARKPKDPNRFKNVEFK